MKVVKKTQKSQRAAHQPLKDPNRFQTSGSTMRGRGGVALSARWQVNLHP